VAATNRHRNANRSEIAFLMFFLSPLYQSF